MNRKDEILKTSYTLFQERGYDQVSVLDICQACNITKPTFYKYIENKESLLIHYYDKVAETLMEELIVRASDPDYFEQAWRGLSFVLEWSVTLGHDLYSHYMQHMLHSHRPTARYNSKATPFTLAAISKAQKSGQMQNQTDPQQLYLLYRNITLGLSCQWCFGKGDFDLMKEARECFEQLMRPDWKIMEEMQKK